MDINTVKKAKKVNKTGATKKRKVSNIMLVVICSMIILYTIAAFILQFFTQIEISPTVTTAWFAFWSTEIVALTLIKTTKVKHGTDGTTLTEDIEDTSEDSNE